MALCKCGCGQELVVKPYCFRKAEFPEFICGHNLKGKLPSPLARRKKKYDESLVGKVVGYCECGCGKSIIFKYYHNVYGIPKYRHGHNPEPIESIEKRKNNLKGRVLRPSWTEEQKKNFKGIKNPMFGKKLTPQHLKAMKDGLIRYKEEDPDRWSEVVRKRLAIIKPNHQESYLDSEIQKSFPGEFKYVGNGEVVLGGKCPDWINVDGKKLIIELFGEHWHNPEDENIRRIHFSKYGFRTLVIWNKELLKGKDAVLEKIRVFAK